MTKREKDEIDDFLARVGAREIDVELEGQMNLMAEEKVGPRSKSQNAGSAEPTKTDALMPRKKKLDQNTVNQLRKMNAAMIAENHLTLDFFASDAVRKAVEKKGELDDFLAKIGGKEIDGEFDRHLKQLKVGPRSKLQNVESAGQTEDGTTASTRPESVLGIQSILSGPDGTRYPYFMDTTDITYSE